MPACARVWRPSPRGRQSTPSSNRPVALRLVTLVPRSQWADYGQSNTIILVELPRGEHKALIEVVDPEGRVLTAQSVTFQSPGQ